MAFSLTPRQQEATRLLAGSCRYSLAYGGARSGKTFLFVRSTVLRALRGEASRHLMGRQKSNAVRSAIWLDTFPKVMRLCFPGVRWQDYRQDGFLEFPHCGSQIWFGGLDDKERVEKILGQEYATIYLSELSQIAYSSYQIAKTRLAQVVPGLKQRFYGDLNPVGSKHWSYRTFVQKVDFETGKPLPNPQDYQHFSMNPGDNSANLSADYLQDLQNLPERQRRRFYDGVFFSDIDGALWTFEMLDAAHMGPGEEVPDLRRVVIAIDPSGAKGKDDKKSDAVGIVAAGIGADDRGYVLDDLTRTDSPSGWGTAAVQAYHRHHADMIVAEGNFGGAMVEHVIKSVDPRVPVRMVTASRGKAVRAEPIAALYEKGMVRHIRQFPALEEQMLGFSTAGYQGDKSPDRADALVWGLTELMLGGRLRRFLWG